jgi:hypothetical protein
MMATKKKQTADQGGIDTWVGLGSVTTPAQARKAAITLTELAQSRPVPREALLDALEMLGLTKLARREEQK